jgi:methanethiol S-methyltransferase
VARVVAWGGGALFVAALAYTFYFYSFVLAASTSAGPRALLPATLINTLLFGVFAVHHSLFARELVKRQVRRIASADLERSVYVWVSSALLIAVCAYWQLVPGVVYELTGAFRWLLYALQLLGIFLTVRGAGLLDPLELAGVRPAERKPDHEMFRHQGPFGVVRHPIYLGWLLMTFAAPTLTMNRLLFAAITSLYLVLAIPLEERSLVTAFGEQYRAYQSRVRWRLIPGVW